MSKSVYLSPSTQGDNIGFGNYGTERDRMNQVCNVVERVLKAHGLTVYRNNPNMTLRQIVVDSNSKNPDVHFAIHSNAGGGQGCEVYCYKFGVVGENLARCIYNALSPITPTSDRGVKQGFNFYGTGKHMYEVAYTNAPAALVEIAFHDSATDSTWIINNIESIGIALAKGVLNYFGISYTEPSNVLYRVMCGSYSIKANADNKVRELKNKGFDAVIMPYGNLYRVMVGSYRIKGNADNRVQNLKNAGYDAVIMPYNA
jgi:N-acetylmuramoyl-L-alanine amidase